MVILHVAMIRNSPFNGVCVAVPQHLKSQAEFAQVALLNVEDVKIDGVEKQFSYTKDFDVRALEAPFNNPDLVVFHELYNLKYLSICKNLKKNRIPYVILAHGELRAEAQRQSKWKKRIANLLLFNKYFKGAAAIQCLSKMEAETTHKGKRKFIGSNGIFIPENYKKDFAKEGLQITYIGRLEVHVKGLDLLLEGVKSAKEQLKDVGAKIDIYGPDYNGRYESVQNLIKETGVEDLVTLHREVSGAEKERVLLNSDVFIQTSRHEGMPMGILEAMSYGLPCLITEGAVLTPFIDGHDAGWTAETTAQSIAEALQRLCAQKDLLLQKSKNARSAVEEFFSWKNVTAKTIAEYKKLIGR